MPKQCGRKGSLVLLSKSECRFTRNVNSYESSGQNLKSVGVISKIRYERQNNFLGHVRKKKKNVRTSSL